MPIENDEDRLLFIDPDEFGATAVWMSQSGAHPPVSCIFDDSFIALAAGDIEVTQEGGRVQITLRTSDVPADGDHKDAVEVASDVIGVKTFTVLEFQPDGTGFSVVRLQEA
ncbi:head-tail joining protein [Shinella zoogloeoides]|uniref:head-tail joining protein n=1 Tax=Shinella zoogloeoides TaxID=352475 RepID=UPI00273DAD1E|nr:hypothetical protein [Shinella zoogloeoides]WLR92177.1 hypothetical protein Q9316_17175 [Shinella zoogloeoides]